MKCHIPPQDRLLNIQQELTLPQLSLHYFVILAMKTISLILILITISGLALQAQDSWTIKWNDKALLTAENENETGNIVTINRVDLEQKQYSLEIIYTEASKEEAKAWKRSISLFNEKDREILRKDSTRYLKINAANLKSLFDGNNQLKIYTMASPTDPALAARVRVRRVHLCTLELQ